MAAQRPKPRAELYGMCGWGEGGGRGGTGVWGDIYAVQLGYNVMKGTKYFVSL